MNNQSDTPDTDEAQFGTGRVTVDFARRLECERNALRASNAELIEALEEMISVGSEYYDMDMGENGSAAIETARAAIANANPQTRNNNPL